MNIIGILLLGLGLSLDTFAVSLSIGLAGKRTSRAQKVRFLLFICLFHALMTFVGWFMGENVSMLVNRFDHWIAFGLLALLGGKMIYEGATCKEGETRIQADFLSLRNTLLLGVALSIDALISGFSLGLVTISIVEAGQWCNILLAAGVIGVVAMVVSGGGIFLGRKASLHMGCRAEIFGGVILVGIGVKVLLEHLF